MAIQYAKDEKIFAQYDYATQGYHKKTDDYTLSKSLIVTNRRLVHQEISNKAGRKSIVRKQIPLEHAQFVDVAVSRTSNLKLLISFILLTLLSVGVSLIGFIPFVKESLDLWAFAFPGAGCFMGLVGLMCLIGYIASFRSYLACSIDLDCRATDGIDFSSKTLRASKKDLRTDPAKHLRLDLSVDYKVGMKMADELGAVILDAIAYVPVAETKEDLAPVAEEACAEPTAPTEEEVAEPTPAVITAPVEETVAEETVAEETPVEETVVEEAAVEEVSGEEPAVEEAVVAEEPTEPVADTPTEA